MTLSILFLSFVTLTGDSLSPKSPVSTNRYTKQTLTNAVLGLGFGIGGGVFYTLGNKAYEDYKSSKTMRSTQENWNKMVLYDNFRNICVAGAIIFTTRAVYYQLKQIKSTRALGFTPIIDIQYADNYRLNISIKRSL